MSFMSKAVDPPMEPPDFNDLSPHTLLAETDEILSTTSRLHNHLVATVTPVSATFANVIRPIVDDGNRATCRLTILSELLAQLSPSRDVRQAARQAEKKIEAARVRNLMRHDVAALVLAVHAKETSAPTGTLDVQDQHLLSYMRGKYMRSGAGLSSSEDRERFRQASDELRDICVTAQDTMIEPEPGVWFEDVELAGVPESVLATMIRDGTSVQVTFRKNHVAAVMRYATSSNARKRLLVANRHRMPENIERLSRAVILRDDIARLLGFEHHAALKMESRMAPSVAYVQRQLEKLHDGLKPVAQAETARLVEYKRKHDAVVTAAAAAATADDGGGHSADTIYEWDKAFYSRKFKEEDSSINLMLFSEYFEAGHTLHMMLSVFEDLFGLNFHPTKISTWHDSVLAFQVWDAPSEGGGFLGWLYVDLFEREGKYRGAHCVGIQPSFVEHDGTTHHPALALVCCYAEPGESRPTLLQHNEVTTMFHELGHAIHTLVGRTKYDLPRSRDYSEVPSNMLENWTWVPDVLIRIGKHYTTLDDGPDSGGNLPRHLVEAVCAARKSNRANAVLAHVWPALFDLAIHTPSTHSATMEMDTTKIWNSTKQQVITTSCGHDPQAWGAGQARFIHMFRHNDAGYFSYPLSQAYAADLFASKFARDPMNMGEGRRWRHQVLAQGASRPEMDILRDFLGREPSVEAIVHEIRAGLEY